MKYNLTRRQKHLLDFIRTFISEKEYCPSYQEMAEGIEAKSRGNIAALIDQLEKRGWIVRGEKMSRSITLLD
jgi:repressor LexA